MNIQDIVSRVGRVLLFVGVQSQQYKDFDWQDLAEWCKEQRIDTLLVKVADGNSVWYQDDTIKFIHQVCFDHGIGFIPYLYCYGNTYGGIDGEIGIVHKYLSMCQYCVCDMEVEWNGRTDWANHFASQFEQHNGILLLSTWADPALQNWVGVLSSLSSCFDAVLPQEYSLYLQGTEGQVSAIFGDRIIPTIDMQNNARDIANTAKDRGHESISIWYDKSAQSDTSTVQYIVNLFKPIVVQKDYTHMDTQFDQVWKSNTLGIGSTGIYDGTKKVFNEGHISACFPTSPEIHTVDWRGNAILFQTLSNGCHVEWYPDTASYRLFDSRNEGIV